MPRDKDESGAQHCDEAHCDNIASIVVAPIDDDEQREVCLDHAISAVDRIGREVVDV